MIKADEGAGKGNPYLLLVGIETRVATVGVSRELSCICFTAPMPGSSGAETASSLHGIPTNRHTHNF